MSVTSSPKQSSAKPAVSSAPEKDLLVRLARAIAPASDGFVVVGGAAHQLFRYVGLAQKVEFAPVRTYDADVAVDPKAVAASLNVDQRLEQLGLRAEMSGENTPPATHYVLPEDSSHFIQFIAPRTGSGLKRDGRRSVTARVAGVVVEKLAYVDVLLREPWTVELRKEHGFPVGDERLELRITNAAAFLAQKLLVLDRRARYRPKDIVYTYDTLLLFASKLDELAALWERIDPLRPKQRAELQRRAENLTTLYKDDLYRAIEQLKALGRRDAPDVAGLGAALRAGLMQIFAAR